MHCNLRTPGVVPVVLGFNYEAHNAPAFKFNTCAASFEFGGPYFRSDMDSLESIYRHFGHILNAHAQKLLFSSFRLKFSDNAITFSNPPVPKTE